MANLIYFLGGITDTHCDLFRKNYNFQNFPMVRKYINAFQTKLHGRGHNSLHEDFEIKQHWQSMSWIQKHNC